MSFVHDGLIETWWFLLKHIFLRGVIQTKELKKKLILTSEVYEYNASNYLNGIHFNQNK